MTETDIVIIGGGIAGASTAYHLAEQGHDVTLLERGDIASEASGVNAGAIGALGWGNVPNLESFLTMGSLEIFKRLQLDLGYDIEFRQSGSLQAIQTEAQYAFIRDRMIELRAQGYRVELLTTREARALEPGLNPALFGCLYMPLRAQADPIKATRALASAAERQGARILVHHEVSSVHVRGDDSYQVETSRGLFGAGMLVIAAGAWCATVGAWLGLRIPIVPVRGQMWATDALPPCVFHTLSSAESSLHWHTMPGHDAETPPCLTHRGGVRILGICMDARRGRGRSSSVGTGNWWAIKRRRSRPASRSIAARLPRSCPSCKSCPSSGHGPGSCPSRSMERPFSARSRTIATYTSSAGLRPLGSDVARWRAN